MPRQPRRQSHLFPSRRVPAWTPPSRGTPLSTGSMPSCPTATRSTTPPSSRSTGATISKYHCPNIVKVEEKETQRERNKTFFLGTFTSQQREDLLDFASEVEFQPGSITEGCHVWTIAKMQGEGLIEGEVNNRTILSEYSKRYVSLQTQ
ncbi:hypothetical protein BV22DRAFT_168904 [Leucogyrophana mollusca]|uniref:Uncharacterized protein n=1 Tax=Leucogyrophana mollusca TaxID=85980 RepID=A0ACB8BTL5_9AGAM|nr:hypothetical protein BV22DRAFT_168904 [Leucogyrophana mollusca]